MKKTILSFLVAVGMIGSTSQSKADTFGSGDNQFTIVFTEIGNPGQQGVSYNYRIGTYEISQNQVDSAIALGLDHVSSGPYGGDRPAGNMTWWESAYFVNWLNTSKGFQPAYNLTPSGMGWSISLWKANDAGYNANNPYRNSLAHYFLPSDSEFYKAGYGLADGSGFNNYSTSSDSPPAPVASGTDIGTAVYNAAASMPAAVSQAGGLSSYGTRGQGGNMWEWSESAGDGSNNKADEGRSVIGGGYGSALYQLQFQNRLTADPSTYDSGWGFRVASVPESSTYALFGLGAILLLMVLRRKKTV
jgi:hypothetical protein